jgi:diacylglycerol O-acyltransferase / wax synthase
MTAPADRLSTLDAEFFFAENDNVPMHIGSVAVFEGPVPTREDVMRLFEAKLPLVPRYRQVVRTAPFQLLRPVWADDQAFSIRHHVRHAKVPAPGRPGQLQAISAKLFARPLDRGRPLWEEWLLDGLADGRWAILSRIHHCMVDGVGGNDLMALVFGTDPDERLPEVTRWVPAPRPSLAGLAADDLRDTVTRPLRRLAAAPGMLRRATAEDALDYGRGLGASAARLAEPSASFLNGPIGPRRRWTWTTASLDELKQIRADRGVTVNDVILAAVTRAFRDLLASRHKLADGLVVRSLVPVSVRRPDEAGAVTNRVAAVLANLPVSEPDPGRRLALIHQQMDSLKHTHQAVGAEILTGVLDFAAPMWLALGTQAMFHAPQPLVQTVTTNVPGPRTPLYVLGRRLTALYPYVPIGNAVRISVAIVSYVGTVSFGITADYDSAPDLDVFVEGIQHGLAELSGQARIGLPDDQNRPVGEVDHLYKVRAAVWLVSLALRHVSGRACPYQAAAERQERDAGDERRGGSSGWAARPCQAANSTPSTTPAARNP